VIVEAEAVDEDGDSEAATDPEGDDWSRRFRGERRDPDAWMRTPGAVGAMQRAVGQG
jgi:hypothetical protein